jgi:hypothetical protein
MHVTRPPKTTIDDVLHDLSPSSREALAPFIEELEQAVLRSWQHDNDWGDWCEVCREMPRPSTSRKVHDPDCIVPGLLEK